ncbi:PLP-dependent aspartate aminotransferase family protein [Flavobacterium sp. AS60]|uniref:trans-sulfuration enzyme family protein n=1 Tax=Flavobacterium anseongense TaxID=2910677 RepID=UPI001F427FDF|nr:PLP-dependent aspartate aminotransferase family protein [Flavobacterium sp. AS60]MCF6129130.1 PLP-dependent aspartate aminotransferase family protein [Flavobacterium sp. AS60]
MQLETLLANITQHSQIKDAYGATHLPIYNTATFDLKRQSSDEQVYDYSRSDNPTRNALETVFAKAENGFGCVCTNTGISAIALVFETVLKTNDHVLIEKDCYGGTYRLLNILFEKNNITAHYADFTNLTEVETILKSNAIKLVVCESPTNPSLKIVDIQGLGKLAKNYNALFAVDNSMATFASQKPLELGADFSVFSSTKFISGHGSVTAGAIVSKDSFWDEKFKYIANAQGRAQSPFDVFLVSLGLPTLTYRMKAQEASALKLAEFLETHPEVLEVKYPGLPSHPQYELAKKQLKIIPAVLTIELKSAEKAEEFIKKCQLFGEKVSFGCADSRLEIPARMSHATNTEEDLAAKGLSNATVRISVGLEDTADLIQDIAQALECADSFTEQLAEVLNAK